MVAPSANRGLRKVRRGPRPKGEVELLATILGVDGPGGLVEHPGKERHQDSNKTTR
jgi:hypothetical protein